MYGTSIVEQMPDTLTVALEKRIKQRNKTAEEWIEEHASGTLRKNKKLGFAWKNQYLHERVAYEFGYIWEAISSSRVTLGKPVTMGDCKPITEVGWHSERYMELNLFSDKFALFYVTISDTDEITREGLALVCLETSAKWVGENKVLLALMTECVKGEYQPCQNPF
jgi:hypothetical protein